MAARKASRKISRPAGFKLSHSFYSYRDTDIEIIKN
jgi:hypothetical protein